MSRVTHEVCAAIVFKMIEHGAATRDQVRTALLECLAETNKKAEVRRLKGLQNHLERVMGPIATWVENPP